MSEDTDVVEGGQPPAAEKAKANPQRRRVLLAVLVVALTIGALLFLRYETRGKYYQETDDAFVQADMVAISPRVGGYVAQVLVADNQEVRAGQPLVRIDERDYQARITQAEAQIAEAEAGADVARAQIGEQQAAIAEAHARLAAARAKADHDTREVARYRPLVAAGAERREQLASLESAAAQSAQDARAQDAALVLQQRRVASLEAQVRQGEAQRQAARAQLSVAKVQVGETLLRAPFAGRVGNKTVIPGQLAQPGMRLMSIVPSGKFYIVANFKETQLALMRPGQPATVSIDALDGLELQGRLSSVSPGTGSQFSILPPQNATGNFTKIVQRVPVRIDLTAAPEALRLLVSGLSVTATVDTISAKGALKRIEAQTRQPSEGQR